MLQVLEKEVCNCIYVNESTISYKAFYKYYL